MKTKEIKLAAVKPESEMTEAELRIAYQKSESENTWLRLCIRRGLAGFIIIGALLAAGLGLVPAAMDAGHNETLRVMLQEQTKQMEMVRGK